MFILFLKIMRFGGGESYFMSNKAWKISNCLSIYFNATKNWKLGGFGDHHTM